VEVDTSNCNDPDIMWNILINGYNAPENAIRLMPSINVYSSETLHDRLYVVAVNAPSASKIRTSFLARDVTMVRMKVY
jgi:hypothetical protein